jgi:magnesium transporter
MELFNRNYHAPGTKPGTLSSQDPTDFVIDSVVYDENQIQSIEGIDESSMTSLLSTHDCKTWLHIQGQPSDNLLKTIVDMTAMHELHAEDILNRGQRPKVETAEDQVFLILNLPLNIDQTTRIEQVCLFVTRTLLVSFCTGDFNPFNKVTERLNKGQGKLRNHELDYLMYALTDSIIDYGFPLLEVYSENIQGIEDELLNTKNEQMLTEIHKVRRELLLIRRRLWPQREVINALLRADDCQILSANTLVHLKDCYDHVIAIMELLETYHEMTSSLMELYLTSVSLKLNDVMKFLTIFTTIFIPPTLLVGIYGMNFDHSVSSTNMPELTWEYGYLVILGLIVTMIGGMFIFFKRKKWL